MNSLTHDHDSDRVTAVIQAIDGANMLHPTVQSGSFERLELHFRRRRVAANPIIPRQDQMMAEVGSGMTVSCISTPMIPASFKTVFRDLIMASLRPVLLPWNRDGRRSGALHLVLC